MGSRSKMSRAYQQKSIAAFSWSTKADGKTAVSKESSLPSQNDLKKMKVTPYNSHGPACANVFSSAATLKILV